MSLWGRTPCEGPGLGDPFWPPEWLAELTLPQGDRLGAVLCPQGLDSTDASRTPEMGPHSCLSPSPGPTICLELNLPKNPPEPA